MEVDEPANAAADGADAEIDEKEWEREVALNLDLMEHDQPESTCRETPGTAEHSVDDSAVEDGEARAISGHMNGTINGNLEDRRRSNGRVQSSEVGHANGILNRRRNGTALGADSSSDSDEDTDIRRPLPRALSPLL